MADMKRRGRVVEGLRASVAAKVGWTGNAEDAADILAVLEGADALAATLSSRLVQIERAAPPADLGDLREAVEALDGARDEHRGRIDAVLARMERRGASLGEAVAHFGMAAAREQVEEARAALETAARRLAGGR